MPPSTTQVTYCHSSDRLDSSAPLGRDSVPEVYISRTGSSSATGDVAAASGRGRTTSCDVGPAVAGRRAATAGSRPRAPPCPPDGGERLARRPAPARPRRRTPLAPAVVEDEGDLVGAEHEVDRHQHDPDPGGGEVQHRELPAVVATAAPAGRPWPGPRRPARPRPGRRRRRARRRSAGRRRRRSRACPGTGGAVRRGRSPRDCCRARAIAALVEGLNISLMPWAGLSVLRQGRVPNTRPRASAYTDSGATAGGSGL